MGLETRRQRAVPRPLATPLVMIFGVALVTALLVGCDADAPAEDAGVYVELLALLPDEPEVRQAGVLMGDTERAREVVGLERPAAEVDGELNTAGLVDYLTGLPDAVQLQFLTGTEGVAYTIPFAGLAHESLGITPFDVDHWVVTLAGERLLTAIRGEFDPVAIGARLDACSECPPADTQEREGWDIYAWGEDFATGAGRQEQSLQLPLYDTFGAGGRLAVSEEVIMRTRVTERLDAMVDAAVGDASLADDEQYRLAAQGLQDLDALQATILAAEGWAFSPSGEGVFAESLQQGGGPFLRPYTVFATGSGYDVGGHEAHAILVLVHEDDADADENGRRLPERIRPASEALQAFAEARPGDADVPLWDDHITAVDVRVDGRVLLATLRGDKQLHDGVSSGAGWFPNFLPLLLAVD